MLLDHKILLFFVKSRYFCIGKDTNILNISLYLYHETNEKRA